MNKKKKNQLQNPLVDVQPFHQATHDGVIVPNG